MYPQPLSIDIFTDDRHERGEDEDDGKEQQQVPVTVKISRSLDDIQCQCVK